MITTLRLNSTLERVLEMAQLGQEHTFSLDDEEETPFQQVVRSAYYPSFDYYPVSAS